MYMSNLFQTYFTFFFLFLFFLRPFDNVSAIRFILSLVKYHNCFITIFLTEKTGKTYRYKHYLQSRHANTPFLLWKKKLTRAGLYLKSIIKRIDKSYSYSERRSFIMLHWETSTSELSWSFFFCIAPSIRVKFSLSSVYSLLFFPCRAL